jgi:hypothetical protein
LKGKTLSQVARKKGGSQFWWDLMIVKKLVMERGRFKTQDGSQTDYEGHMDRE